MKTIAPQVELFLVVGSANSSNSVRMVEVALAAGARAAHLVENAEAIDPAWLDGVTTVGCLVGCVGARDPGARGDRLAGGAGLRRPQEVSHTEERLTFALPRELRRDLRAAK